MKNYAHKLSLLLILLTGYSCESEIFFSTSEKETTETYVEPLEKNLLVCNPLKSDIAARRIMGYAWDYAKYSTESSVWRKMFMVAVFDKETLEPWRSQEHGDFGHLNYDKHKYIPHWNNYVFYFPNDNSSGIDSLMSFVKKIPENNYVLFYSFRGNNCKTWLNGKPISAEYKEFLTNIGASVDKLETYMDNYPYILFFKKGDSSFTEDVFYDESATHSIISFETTLRNY